MLGSELDTYEAIEAAVNETTRGRAFLAEHALRARQAETLKVLAAIERLEQCIEQYWPSNTEPESQEIPQTPSPNLPLPVRTGSVVEEAFDTTGAQLPNSGFKHSLPEERVLLDIANALRTDANAS